MALNIKSKEADRLARELAERTGESITEAVTKALQERLARQKPARRSTRAEAIQAICERTSKLPWRDDITNEEAAGYNRDGTWD